MDSRRLVVWISTGILGFQGATLAFDLLNCTALSWLYVRLHGLPARSAPEQPVAAFCRNSQGRIDAAVTQGLGILAGLALGGSVGVKGEDQP